ncbi:transcriptional regulator [Lactiplantibacillus fabifermentans T30PCM01]|uniref:Transcriptional regulator n=1 Tax=Lactiplantibacillus fabifermentans T30PCM01 TaxID=1400520 RepID=W6T784_9LACO|nr:helix-turn-helix domain-containing protein [Lactiplantibacillus fabifermentans]ETY74009.1 transcriptional regulator [Lactiplantibacillus fabifermentans T30PCM01]
MAKSIRSQLAKLMADEKVLAVIRATTDQTGLTPKQIAQATDIPINQLYYTINKLVAADLLTVVKQVKVKNLDEYYYSSYNFTHEQNTAMQAELAQFPAPNNISSTWTQEHLTELMQLLLFHQQQFLTALETQVEAQLPAEQMTTFSAFSDLKLSAAGEQQLRSDLLHLLANAEKNDPDSAATDKQTVNLLIEKW